MEIYKTSLIVCLSIILAFGLVLGLLFANNYLIKNMVEMPFNKRAIFLEKIDSQIFELETGFNQNYSKQKLFILGSSHAHYLNTTQIQNNLLVRNQLYEVHNLSRSGDNPIWRSEYLQLMIDADPKIIVYGIAYRDLEDTFGEWVNMKNDFPSVKVFFNDLMEPLSKKIRTDFSDNPKLVSLSIIKEILNYNYKEEERDYLLYKDEFIPYPNSYFTIAPYNINSKSDEELKNHFLQHTPSFSGLGEPQNNKKVKALLKMINAFKENDIKIILFITPHSKYYLDEMPASEKTDLINTISYIEDKAQLKIYSLENKYAELLIWSDLDHVALTQNKIYGDDISEIILKEIRK